MSEKAEIVEVRGISTITFNNNEKSAETLLIEEFRTTARKLTGLDEAQKQIFLNLLYNHREVFLEKDSPARGYKHQLKIKTDKQIIRKLYPVPPALRGSRENNSGNGKSWDYGAGY